MSIRGVFEVFDRQLRLFGHVAAALRPVESKDNTIELHVAALLHADERLVQPVEPKWGINLMSRFS
jgi:hypothetical protein